MHNKEPNGVGLERTVKVPVEMTGERSSCLLTLIEDICFPLRPHTKRESGLNFAIPYLVNYVALMAPKRRLGPFHPVNDPQ